MTQPNPAPPGDPTTTTPPADPAPNPATQPDDKPLGPAGEKALAAERKARQELEKRVAALAPLEKLAAALVGNTSTEPGRSEVDVLRERF